MARLNVQTLSFGLVLAGCAVLAASACSNSSSEEKAAAKVSQACTLNSDCSNPLVCAFQRCHQQCTETRDCGAGERCVKEASKDAGEGGQSTTSEAGVCQLPVEKACTSSGAKCAADQQCAEDKQCHDVCQSDADCFNKQVCTPTGSCAENTEVDDTGNITPSSTGGTGGGTGGTGARGGSGGTGGTDIGNGGLNGETNGLGGEGGAGTVVNECPDTKGMNPVEHQSETVSAAVSWSGLHHVSGTLYVGATLELKPCTVVEVDANATIELTTNGSIHALGATNNPVVFTSAKSPPAAGDWGGINIEAAASNDSLFQNVILEYGGSYDSPLTVNEGAKASLVNVLVRHTDPKTCAIRLYSGATLAKFVGVRTEDSDTSLCVGANTIGALGSFSSDGAGISVQSETVTDDAEWQDFGVPYLMGGSWYIQGKVTLDPGVTIHMPSGAWLDVNSGGSLQSVGTKDQPVTFTSAKKSPDAGDWGYLEFEGTSSNDSVLQNTVVEYGAGTSLQIDNGASLAVTDSTFQHSDDNACAVIWQSNSRITDFSGVTFNDTPCPLQVPASLVGDLTSFTADSASGDVTVQTETLTKAITWKDYGSAYRLNGSMYTNAAWTLAEGVTIKMPSGAWLDASSGGSIKVNGTKDKPVTFRSFIDDAGEGDWQYIEIENTAAQSSVFTYAVIQDSAQGIVLDNNKLTLDHCKFGNNTCDVKTQTTSTLTATSTDYVACP